MGYRQIHKKVKQFKAHLLILLPRFIEPILWEEFLSSKMEDHSGRYRFFNHDHLSIRDLKALMNMLTAMERATESYAFIALSFCKRLALPLDALDFYRNYKIYMSSNSVLSDYLKDAHAYFIRQIWPYLLAQGHLFLNACTLDNLENAGEFVIEKIIALERYQQNYLLSQKDKAADEKKEPSEGILDTLIKQNDQFLKKIFKTEYDTQFKPDSKEEIKESIAYYSEPETKSATLLHVRKLSNAIIGIKKVLEDYENYKQSGLVSSVMCMASFLSNLRRVYTLLQEFNYQAVMAEKAGPLAEKIKLKLKEFNLILEQLAVALDDVEGEQLLKENTLLKYVKILIDQYSEITYELKIAVDYASQRNIFGTARLRAREQKIALIQSQLNQLDYFMQYQDTPLAFIPYTAQKTIKAFIENPINDLCADKKELVKYSAYLTKATDAKITFRVLCASTLEYAGNRCQLTLHSKMMKIFRQKQGALASKNVFLQKRLNSLERFLAENRFKHFVSSELKTSETHEWILEALKKHEDLLKTKKNALRSSLPDHKEEKKPIKVKERLTNKISLATEEQGLFSRVSLRYANDKNFPELLKDLKEKDTLLSPDTVIFLEEMKEVALHPSFVVS